MISNAGANPTGQGNTPTSDAWFTVLSGSFASGYVINKGTVDAQFRINGKDASIAPLFNGGSVNVLEPFVLLEVRRIPAGTDVTGIFAIGFEYIGR